MTDSEDAAASETLEPLRGAEPSNSGGGGVPAAIGEGWAPRGSRNAISGWLLVLCVLLLVWQPLSLALVASDVLRSLPVYGVTLAIVLLARVFVAAFGIAAGLALVGRRSGAVTMAKISLILSAAMDAFIYTTPFFPNNRAPGETPLYVAASLLYSGIWMLYLFRSRRVARTYEHWH